MNDHQAETYRSMVSLSTEALKTLFLINGGAVVALLAYLGQAASRNQLARRAECPLAFFVAGLVLCALAFGSAYRTQLAIYNEAARGAAFSGTEHPAWLKRTFVLALASLASFVCGAFASIYVLGHS